MASSKANEQHYISYVYSIRPARQQDLQYLPAVERSAQAAFRGISEVEKIADDEPASPEEHARHINESRRRGLDDSAWVAVANASSESSSSVSVTAGEADREVVGFITAMLVHGSKPGEAFLHIEELSVHAAHQRKGLASRLMQAVREAAGQFNASREANEAETGRRIVALTLTTFRDVPFNAPFYQRFGFTETDTSSIELWKSLGDEARQLWNTEQERFRPVGLATRRCWMECKSFS